MNGPVVSTDLYDFATLRLRDEVEKRASSEASKAAHTFSNWVTGQIQQAYTTGLRDGFAQGVQSAHYSECKVCHGRTFLFSYRGDFADLINCKSCQGNSDRICGTDQPSCVEHTEDES